MNRIMLKFTIALLLLFMLTSCDVLKQEELEVSTEHNPPVENNSIEDKKEKVFYLENDFIEKAEEFCAVVFGKEPVELWQLTRVEDDRGVYKPVSKDEEGIKSASKYRSFTIGPEPKRRHAAQFTVDMELGMVTSYMNRMVALDHVPEDLHKNWDGHHSADEYHWKEEHMRLSGEEAFEGIKPLLEYYGQSTNMDDYQIEKNHRYYFEPCYWRIKKNYTYNGIPSDDNWLSIKVSAFSGRIEYIHNEPFRTPPVRPGSVVSKEKALKTARKSYNRGFILEKLRYWNVKKVNTDIQPDDVEAVIVHINDSRTRRSNNPKLQNLSRFTRRFAWKCTFYTDSLPTKQFVGTRNAEVIYVDQETGVIIAFKEYPVDTLYSDEQLRIKKELEMKTN